jgi:hypothetical protein
LSALFIERWSDFIVFRHDAEDALLADLRALLTEDQQERWPPVERMRRREGIVLTQSRSSTLWHRVDLVKIVEKAGLSESERVAIAPVMEEYELLLDKPLAELRAMWGEEMRWPKERQEREAKALEERSRDIGSRLTPLNRRYAKQVMTLLDPVTAENLDDAVRRVAYSRIYELPRPSIALVAAVEKVDDLTEDQAAKITAIKGVYVRDSALLDKARSAALDGCEDDAARWWNDDLQRDGMNPWLTAWEDTEATRKALEKKTDDAVMAVLSPSQREKVIPK